MEINVNDIFIEFLEIAFHYLLFVYKIYPKEIFEDRKKYGASVKYSIHPQVNSYITNCLTSIKEVLIAGCLEKVAFCVLDADKIETHRCIFDALSVNADCTRNEDHYLIRCEQNLRAFFMKLSNSDAFTKPIPDGNSFTVMVHTTESAAVNLAKKPELEHFPLIEYEPSNDCIKTEYFILPIHTVNIDLFKAEVYLEHL
ncbi:DNA polymerase zeta subunit 2 [Arctopsyche grandis]|uniref:DNA polymerase zeta subunit 2 n=1 Tax=Arctopsyche grandis TaxID=121162 RepID=UPI00406D9F65